MAAHNGRRDEATGGRGRGSLLLANERTFLAQVRTGVAVMALGFVVAKFALVVRELDLRRMAEPSSGRDPLIGAAITVLGALVVIAGAVRYLRRHRSIESGAVATSPALDIVLAALLAAGGLGLALLLTVQGGVG